MLQTIIIIFVAAAAVVVVVGGGGGSSSSSSSSHPDVNTFHAVLCIRVKYIFITNNLYTL
jgi:hypothetical protein